MLDSERVPDGIDTSVPSSVQVYDYLLGGKDNYTVDRMVAETADSDPETVARLRMATEGTPAQSTFRPHDELIRFFDGFTLVEPGLVPVQKWRPIEAPATPTRVVVEGGVAALA
ncbi:SAM-dependent methyltransferase [Microtetraspora sp. NBRC 16547]|uniref:SAM-dependent methyltransferase n=1 Tax=Microtetraspora sp. NBRC 16547 TaxID=3030993 RepID=UPI0024A2108F|nr:SAM-dependent methyltransferase [Microtetraspora sp. NBRC 16547]GLW97030.1 hypothetical protein Misp02_11170 [Microtetraspora sp. NBRC 16547]